MSPNELKILIADDEPDILEILSYNLKKEHYDVYTAKDGNDAVSKARTLKPHLIILDIMMPGKTGLEVCEIIRTYPEFDETFIIFLTALNDEKSHIKGLELGGDDYLTKPVSPKVLTARINTLFRRMQIDKTDNVIKIDELIIDPERFEVDAGGEKIILAKKEFELLYLLASKPGKVFLRNEILDKVWGNEVIVGDRTIDVHIRKIRQKLGQDYITTVKGVGYKFKNPD